MAATDKKGVRPAVKHMSINLSSNSKCNSARESTEIKAPTIEEARTPNMVANQSVEDILSKLIAGD